MQIEVQENVSMKNHTSFKVGGIARLVYFPKTKEELVELLTTNPKAIVLGNCSNTIVSSMGIDEELIITTKMNDYSVEGTIFKANCGAKGPLLAQKAQEEGLSGFEYMIGFPGTIGGMLYMNASAHNQETATNFIEAEVFDRKSKRIIKLNKKEMEFSYRKSVLTKKDYVVLNAIFELQKQEQAVIDEIMQRNLEFRKLRQPTLSLPNAGSTFKNPDNDSAGRLLDLAGAKELEVGGAKVWENHANFIVNDDNATSEDILNLMYKMYNVVKEKYTIELKSELKYLGKMTKEEEEIWKILTKNMAKTQG
jgi:UDP-N-acetylmuramate dehydrogenase